ncbi:MAG: hypothetical protein ACK5MA_11455 [Parachlamydiaceae bacterium]
MNRYLLSLIVLFSSASCFADASLERVAQLSGEVLLTESEFDFSHSLCKKYQAAAKFQSPEASHSSSSRVETHLVTYETTALGVNCHVGWYTDGFIVTSLDGTEEGKQCVFVNGSIIGISYDVKIHRDFFEHKYTWGKVYSYPYKQEIKYY